MPNPPGLIGVAVSGGGDSMALLHLMHGFCALHGSKLRAVTVNHGLRAEAEAEAAMVHRYCASLGVPHDVLLWNDWDGSGNLQEKARDARFAQIGAWADTHGVQTVVLGHTADDQAETFLMRLARRSGVNGLSGIPQRTLRGGVTWVRPLLGASREELRSYLRIQHIDWVEDPSNEDRRFERVRTRQALEVLEGLGITASVLSDVSVHMTDARKALEWQTFLAAREIACVDAGAVVIDARKFRILPEEIQRRLLVCAVNWISGEVYTARRAAIGTVMSSLRKGQAATADGVHIRSVNGRIWVFRELNAVRDAQSGPEGLWDDRWRVSPGEAKVHDTDLEVRALGEEGLLQCPDWRASGRPHEVLLSTPAVWKGDTVVAAPLAGLHQKWHADIDGGGETFFAALLTH